MQTLRCWRCYRDSCQELLRWETSIHQSNDYLFTLSARLMLFPFPQQFSASHTKQLETWIDQLDAELTPLKNFVIPVFQESSRDLSCKPSTYHRDLQSGGLSATHLHLSRTICRRTERAVVPLVAAKQVDEEVGKYLNRLSDLLFVTSRWAANICWTCLPDKFRFLSQELLRRGRDERKRSGGNKGPLNS